MLLAVLLGHGLLWQALRPVLGTPALQATHRPAPQLVLRLLELPAPAPLPRAVAEAPPRRPSPRTAPVVPLAAVPMLPPPAAASPAPAGSAELPVYATRLPDPGRLHYRLLRGANVGTGALHWQRGEGGYALRLDVEWPGQPAQGSASRGQINPNGVAPQRHAELRRAREQRAVNFQR